MKHAIVSHLQKYLINPPVRVLLALGLAPPFYALLETTGRKSGKPRRTPVGNGLDGDVFWLITELGVRAQYVKNIRANPRVRVRVRRGLRQQWLTGTAHILPDEDPRARQRQICRAKPGRKLNALILRTLGTDMLTIRIELEHATAVEGA
jgi:deazaflavin-dependent oxidoreductase (nitroreductase family)